MIEDVVFHLGDCKTGTTSIQRTLKSGAWEAEGVRIIYPTPAFNHIYLTQTLKLPEGHPIRRLHFRRLRRTLTKSDATHAVVSAEHFEFVDPMVLKRAIEKHLPRFQDRIRLIAYVRPHCARLVSQFSEHCKKGGEQPTPAALHTHLMRSGQLKYAPRFEKWRAVFGEKFTLRPMIPMQLKNNDVVEDFFDYLLEGRAFRLAARATENTTLSVEDIALMREIQSCLPVSGPDSDAELREPKRALGGNISPILSRISGGAGTKPRLDRALVNEMQRIYQTDAARLDAAFFEGTPMSDALTNAGQEAVDRPQSFDAQDHFSAREIRHAHVYAAFLRRLMSADPQFFNLATLPEEKRGKRPRQAYVWIRLKQSLKNAASRLFDLGLRIFSRAGPR